MSNHGNPGGNKCNRIEAVTVSVNYADFLDEAMKHNRGLFDKWVIVTSKDDTATQEVCRKYSIVPIVSDDAKRGGPFNKGRLIERGLQHLSANGWRIHIDADIILPSTFRQIIAASYLQESNIYGADRIMVKDKDQWDQLRTSGWLTNDFHVRVNFPAMTKKDSKGNVISSIPYPVGTRWAHHGEGYVPIGFFQMWHSSQDQYNGARSKPYPNIHNNACRTDVQFGLQWDRHHRELLPELLVVHLESEAVPMGTNWTGRKTKKFK